ncbi:kinase [Thraustotheca clavata]|uniref:Kinase n=1 Tax=Thraustotheca clavata TaxID=74557 RepID=A0A1V9Y7L2_9STRA|nr:kinase [Thraustotheca clavata]
MLRHLRQIRVLVPLCAIASNPIQNESINVKSINERYDVGRQIGVGGFSVVKIARNKGTGEEVAAKFFNMKCASRDQIEAEIHMLQSIGRHKNIVSLQDVIYEPQNIIMIMDLVRGGELFDYIVEKGSMTEADASRILRDVCMALDHLHHRGVCHRDLKPENLLLTDTSEHPGIKIADFGLSQHLRIGQYVIEDHPMGTAVYWAPEIIKRAPQDVGVDMWAFGVLLYITLTGIHPFDPNGNRTDAQILSFVAKGDYDIDNPYYKDLSPQAKDLIAHLLEVDPKSRYTATQALAHPWLLAQDATLPLSDGLTTRLQAYRRLQKLRANILTVILSQSKLSLTKEPLHSPSRLLVRRARTANIDMYMEVFLLFDQDNSGSISKEELTNAMHALGQRLTPAEIDSIMQMADVDGDGGISFDEFVSLMNSSLFKWGTIDEHDMQMAFQIFDTNHDGFISADELSYVINMFGNATPLSKADITELMQSIDTNGDGKIDYNEFVALMSNMMDLGLNKQESLCTPQFEPDIDSDDVFSESYLGHAFYSPCGDLHLVRQLNEEMNPPCFISTIASSSITSEEDLKEEEPARTMSLPAPRPSRYYSAISGLKSLSSATGILGKGKSKLLSKIPYSKPKFPRSTVPTTLLQCSNCPPKAPSKLSLYRQKSGSAHMWTCSQCPDIHLCEQCYRSGVHGLEDTPEMKIYDTILNDLKWMKKCKAFTRELLVILRVDICKSSPPKYQFMCQWLADILGNKPVAKITMRGVAMKDVPAEARQKFVGALMPIVANRSDLEVNIEWATSSPTESPTHLEHLRLWISDKKGRRESPFETSLLTTELHDNCKHDSVGSESDNSLEKDTEESS